MSKHELHIALLCLAMIVAGVLGYQVVNNDGESTGYSTDIFTQTEVLEQQHDSRIEILPPGHFDNKAEVDKSTFRDKSRIQDSSLDDDPQILPWVDESEPNEISGKYTRSALR